MRTRNALVRVLSAFVVAAVAFAAAIAFFGSDIKVNAAGSTYTALERRTLYGTNRNTDYYILEPNDGQQHPVMILFCGLGGMGRYEENMVTYANNWVDSGTVGTYVYVIPYMVSHSDDGRITDSELYDYTRIRGNGKSDMIDLVDQILAGNISDQIDTTKDISVAGYSMGGAAALYAGINDPDRLVNVGALSPAYLFYNPNGWGWANDREMTFNTSDRAHLFLSASQVESDGGMYNNLVTYMNLFEERGVPHVRRVFPTGEHTIELFMKEIYSFIYLIENDEKPSFELIDIAEQGINPYAVENAQASIGNRQYETVEEAIAAASPTDTVKLLNDIDHGITIDRSLELDINGHIITSFTEEPAVSIEDGTDGISVRIIDSGFVSEGGIVGYSSQDPVTSSAIAIDIDLGYSNVEINGVSVLNIGNNGITATCTGTGILFLNVAETKVTANNSCVAASGANCSVFLDNCTCINFTDDNEVPVIYVAGDAFVTVKDGRYSASARSEEYDPFDINDVTIYSGQRRIAQHFQNKLAWSFTSNPDYEDEIYYVASVARTGDNYRTVAEAIAAASAGDTIVLYYDTDESFTVDKNLTLFLNLHSIGSADALPETAITIADGVELTVYGVGSVTGSECAINAGNGTLYLDNSSIYSDNGTAIIVNNGTVEFTNETSVAPTAVYGATAVKVTGTGTVKLNDSAAFSIYASDTVFDIGDGRLESYVNPVSIGSYNPMTTRGNCFISVDDGSVELDNFIAESIYNTGIRVTGSGTVTVTGGRFGGMQYGLDIQGSGATIGIEAVVDGAQGTGIRVTGSDNRIELADNVSGMEGALAVTGDSNLITLRGGTYSCASGNTPFDWTQVTIWRGMSVIEADSNSWTVGVPALCAHSLTLQGDIGVNFYFSLPEGIDASSVSARITYNGNTRSVTYSQTDSDIRILADPEVINGTTFTVRVTQRVAPKDMEENIHIVLFNGTDAIYADDYTMNSYLNTITASDNTAVGNLAVAIRDYCSCAQGYFSGGTMPNVTAVSPDDIEGCAITDPALVADFNSQLREARIPMQVYGASLVLRTQTTLRIYFEIDEEYQTPLATIRSLRTVIDGVEVSDPFQYKAGNGVNYVYIDIENINAVHLSDSHTISISNGTASGSNITFTVSPSDYIYDQLAGSRDASLKTLLSALWNYRNAAVAYFNEAQG